MALLTGNEYFYLAVELLPAFLYRIVLLKTQVIDNMIMSGSYSPVFSDGEEVTVP